MAIDRINTFHINSPQTTTSPTLPHSKAINDAEKYDIDALTALSYKNDVKINSETIIKKRIAQILTSANEDWYKKMPRFNNVEAKAIFDALDNMEAEIPKVTILNTLLKKQRYNNEAEQFEKLKPHEIITVINTMSGEDKYTQKGILGLLDTHENRYGDTDIDGFHIIAHLDSPTKFTIGQTEELLTNLRVPTSKRGKIINAVYDIQYWGLPLQTTAKLLQPIVKAHINECFAEEIDAILYDAEEKHDKSSGEFIDFVTYKLSQLRRRSNKNF